MAARAAELGQPALGLTDHGVMNGAVDLYKACKQARDQADRRPRGLLRRRPQGDQGAGPLRAQPPDPAGRERRRLRATWSSSPRPASSRASRAARRTSTWSCSPRHSEGVIALTGCLQSRFCRRLVEERADDARAHLDDLIQAFGPEQVYFEVQKNGIAEQDKANEGIVRFARELGRPLVGTADVHYLRREDYDNHAALLCVQTKSTLEAAEAELRHQRVLPQELRGDGRVLRRVAGGGADHARDRRALRRRDRARQAAAAALPDRPTARSRRRCCAGSPARACARRYGDPLPAEARRAARVRARGDRGDGLRLLLPDRLGLRPLREGERRSRSARAAARRPARSSPTRSTSPTSTRSPTTCSSSASSTPGASRCRTSTSTSRSAAASG